MGERKRASISKALVELVTSRGPGGIETPTSIRPALRFPRICPDHRLPSFLDIQFLIYLYFSTVSQKFSITLLSLSFIIATFSIS